VAGNHGECGGGDLCRETVAGCGTTASSKLCGRRRGLFVAGLLLRWWAIITLGRFFTVDVTIEKDHELVERGPFRIVRHPSYTGVLLAFVGLALSLCNLAVLLVILLPIGAAFVHRMNVEENALSAALGSQYTDYMRRTKRLVPFVY
jgi:protein-S-isoprenylcysteine O-methyltransferase Ste14